MQSLPCMCGIAPIGALPIDTARNAINRKKEPRRCGRGGGCITSEEENDTEESHA